ncbi:CTRB1 [Cervus elaphus hippelaphus]|uniref:CTRB1 n=1 Tax=Cervus elaphus hippelaphus TaxID=46360 RepID=A0A212DC02_CEREH|nr:CTRB1 [Cervus elaphus hippelaphus]
MALLWVVLGFFLFGSSFAPEAGDGRVQVLVPLRPSLGTYTRLPTPPLGLGPSCHLEVPWAPDLVSSIRSEALGRCSPFLPGVYARVTKFIPWILEVLEAN